MTITKRNITILVGNLIWFGLIIGSCYLFLDWAIAGADAWVGEDQNRNPFGWVLFLGVPAMALAFCYVADNYSKGFLYLLNKIFPK